MIKELVNLRDLELAWEKTLHEPVFFFRMEEAHSESLEMAKLIKTFCWEETSSVCFYRFFIPQQESICQEIVRLTWAKKSTPQLLLVYGQELIWYHSGAGVSLEEITRELSQISSPT